MQTYLVGGAVRDALLGLPVQDRDWVVVGATPEAMVAQGFLPVGRDFPVFLHPDTKEEYALARTERKSAPGYRGFVVHAAPDVTLEQDLARRDITINSIAVHADSTRANGQFDPLKGDPAAWRTAAGRSMLVDPFGGVSDLDARLLRHTTSAFSEDPVRILRVARFAARFPDFSVAPATLQLMRQMVQNGEASHLVPERVWQELAKGLMTPKPSRMIDVLAQCGALALVWPQAQGQDLAALDAAAAARAPLPVRYACLACRGARPEIRLKPSMSADPGDAAAAGVNSFQTRLPRECAELAALVGALTAAEQAALLDARALDADGWLALLEHTDALRRPERFEALLQVLGFVGTAGGKASAGLQTARGIWQAAQTITIKSIADHAGSTRANSQFNGKDVGQQLRLARLAAVSRQQQLARQGTGP